MGDGYISVPKKMQAAVLRGPNDLVSETQEVPQPGPGEMLVRIRACGICGSDLMDWYVEQKAPFVFGHEPTGDVVRVGAGVTAFRPGDRVVLHHHAPCKQCEACLRGDTVHCPVWREQALLPGGMAEYAIVAAQSVRHDTHLLPADVSYEAGTLVEPVACALKALRRANFAPGMRVLVIGLGFTGQLFGLLARYGEAGALAGSDVIDARLRLAEEHWADEVYDVSARELPAASWDLVVVTPGSSEAILAGLGAVRNGGALLLFGPPAPGQPTPFPVDELLFREVTVVTSYSAGPADTREALPYIIEGRLPVDALISHRFGLDEVEQAYAMAQDATRSMKVIVTME